MLVSGRSEGPASTIGRTSGKVGSTFRDNWRVAGADVAYEASGNRLYAAVVTLDFEAVSRCDKRLITARPTAARCLDLPWILPPRILVVIGF